MKYPLSSSSWDQKEYAALQRVIDSGFFTMGKEVAAYEQAFAQCFQSQYAVMVSSGSTANLLMIAALFFAQNPKHKLQRGDEIIVPTVSWSTTYFPLQQYGLKLKFVDIDKETLNLDLNQLEQAITSKTRAVLTVNLLGNPNDFERLEKILSGTDIVLLEDNCESMGATFADRQAGSFGLMGTFSSFFSHHISTMEGGCIITDDEHIYHTLLCLRAHGWTRDLPEHNHITGQKSADSFEESFKFVLPGYNARPLEMSGAVGLEQLKKLPHFIQQRRANAEKFQSMFAEHPFLAIQKEVGQSSWFGFALVLKPHAPYSRTQVLARLRQAEIECRPIVTGNFLKNTALLTHFDYEVFGDPTHAQYIETMGLFVGNHPYDLSASLLHLYEVLGT
jgi:dTDP-4-amino-4,6-dideoxygalactose transaminase